MATGEPKSTKPTTRKTTAKAKPKAQKTVRKPAHTEPATIQEMERKGIGDRVRDSVEGISMATPRKKAAQWAKSAVEFQHKSALRILDAVDDLQVKSEERIQQFTDDASYVPSEGKKLVNEWIRFGQKTRNDFRKSTDKTYSLVEKYFDRREKTATKAEA